MGDILQERDDNVYTNANNVAVTRKVLGDANNRFQQFPTGEMQFGDGTLTPDCGIKRSGTSTLTQTGTLITGGAIAANGDTLAVTQALHANKVVQFGKLSGTICTLPASTGSGDKYTFIIGIAATSNANVIKVANSTDVMDGSINLQQDTDVAGTLKMWKAAVGDDTMSFAGTATSGGIIGARIECVDYKAGFWSCLAFTSSGGGSEATPFTATV